MILRQTTNRSVTSSRHQKAVASEGPSAILPTGSEPAKYRKVVFLIWAADGRFPGPQSMDPEDLEEERRLMYVATTRAKDELYLSYPIYMFDRAMGYTMGRVSRFLEDMAPEILPTAMLQESEDNPA